MDNHDEITGLNKQQAKMLTDKELIEKITPELSDLCLDIEEIRANSANPLFLGLMMARLIKEREKTNKILEGINEKYDKIMFEFKTKDLSKESAFGTQASFQALPEQDQVILDFIDKNQGTSAKQIKEVLNYKGMNAASQRLNKLFREGHLRKVQAGKSVLYLI